MGRVSLRPPPAWRSPAAPICRLVPAMKHSWAISSALPLDPWLHAVTTVPWNSACVGGPPGPCGVVWWEGPAGQPRGSQGRRALSFGLGPGPAEAKDLFLVSDFSSKLDMASERTKEEALQTGRECVCVRACIRGQIFPCKLNSASTKSLLYSVKG